MSYTKQVVIHFLHSSLHFFLFTLFNYYIQLFFTLCSCGYVHFFIPLLPVKGCVCYIFASLFCMSKREHLWKKEKSFLFHFKSSFRSWDNQILTFQILNIMTSSNAWNTKHILRNTWEVNTVWSWNLASLCNITKEKFSSKNYMKNVARALVPGLF